MASVKRNINYDLKYYQSTLEPNVAMAISIQDQQRIFLAYRALFEGQNAQLRQPKAIKRVLISSKKSSSPLVQNLGFDKVVSVLKGLLEKGIFSSDLAAKLAFPILYETSPAQDARHEASDAGAAKEEAEALQEVEALDNAAVEEAGVEVFEFEDASLNEESKAPAAVDEMEGPKSKDREFADTKQEPYTDVPSLYPVQFPFRVQYSILTKTQKILEECCYDFTEKYAPSLLAEKNWDCAEAIELNKWTLTVIKRYGKFPDGAFRKSDSGIHQVLLAVNKLRHSAVHRLRISAKGIVLMVDAAVKFADTLSDTIRATQLGELHKELKSKIQSQELNKNYLETKLKNELDEIECQREELAKREREAISAMVIEDKDNMHFIGSLLEGNLRNILDGENADDDDNRSDPNDQLDHAKAETTDDEPCKEDLPKEPESSQIVSNRSRSIFDTDGAEIVTETTKGGSTEKDGSSRESTNCAEDQAEEPSPGEAPVAEPEAVESPPELTGVEAEVDFAQVEERPAEEPESGNSITEPQPEIEAEAVEPLKLATQRSSIADAVQAVLESQKFGKRAKRRESNMAVHTNVR